MNLYPAIDLRDGKCVRLQQGDFERETIYMENPIVQAQNFEAEGAEFIHIVDLDAAKTGEPVNRAVIAEMVAAVSAFIQVGGGVRTEADAKELADLGVDRAVVGTAAVRHPERLEAMARHISLAAGLDYRDGKLAIKGWIEDTELGLMESAEGLLDPLVGKGVQALIVTNIGNDGMLDGPDESSLLDLLQLLETNQSEVKLIASGGVGSVEDLRSLRRLKSTGLSSAGGLVGGSKKLDGAIVGKAIYEGAIGVGQALRALSE